MSTTSTSLKYGILITVCDRVDYVKNTLNQLYLKTDLSILKDTFFIIIDDGSVNDIEIYNCYIDFKTENKFFIRKPFNKGISSSIRMGFDILYSMGIDYIINLDSDINLELDWVYRIINLYNDFDDKMNIVNGWYFPNLNGIEQCTNFVYTSWMSGVSSFFHNSLYESLRYELFDNKDIINLSNFNNFLDEDVKLNKNYNQIHWDIALSEIFQSKDKKFICCNPPCIEHIGRIGKNTKLEYDIIKNDFKQFDYLI
jgi:hypothetical protein